MFFSPRIRIRPLAQLCHRLATSTNAGLHDLKIWRSEAGRGDRIQRAVAAEIAETLETGQSITAALRESGAYFPPLFRQLVEVGDISGRLGPTYDQLASYYDRRIQARRTFLSALAWPMLQLTLALVAIGVLILVMGMLPANQGSDGFEADLLGLGLVGMPGFIKYVALVLLAVVLLFVVVEASRRGALWIRPLQRAITGLPVIGSALKTIALARFTWALSLVLDTPMDIRRSLPLALRASGNDYFAQHGRDIVARIEAGQSITSSFAETGIFPTELLDEVAVGEEGGRLVETMRRKAVDYAERATIAMGVLARVAGYGVWLLVAAFIVMMIFRLFGFYVSQIQELTKPI